MKLGELDVETLVKELDLTRSAWLSGPEKAGRKPDTVGLVTICLLAARERTLNDAAKIQAGEGVGSR